DHSPPPNVGLALAAIPGGLLLLSLPSSHPNLGPTGAVTGPTNFGTWRWDGTDWSELVLPDAPPYVIDVAFHVNPGLVVVPGSQRLLYFSWAVYSGSCPPPPRCSVPDPTGTVYGHTWTFADGTWTRQTPPTAPASTE